MKGHGTGGVAVRVVSRWGYGKIVAPRPVLAARETQGRGTGSVAIVLDETTRKLLDGKNFATVATVNPDGGPQSSVVWILRDGDTVLFSAISTRRKVLNLTRDPRISMTVFDAADPYQSVELRGTAELTGDPGKSLPRALSQKYLGEDPPPEPDEVSRVIVRVIPERINAFGV
jgi:PPOX class probable F420-dependent enzyme